MSEPASKEDIQKVMERIDSLDRAIRGDNGKVGLSGRVNVNEKDIKRISWHLRTVWATFLGSIVSGVTWVLWR